MKRNTIAYLSRTLAEATGSNSWHGIESRCRKEKIPLITFCGRTLNEDMDSILYHIFDPSKVSGVITWASSNIGQGTTDYYKKYGRTPVVSMSLKLPGYPLIQANCRAGIEEMMDHFIEVHGIRKIAFVRGPVDHIYAKERYDGYLSSLRKHGITINEKLISEPGTWNGASGDAFVTKLIKQGMKPGRDFEAIIAVGDNVAIGVLESLQRNGIKVPDEVKVGGFNGSNEALFSNPPITTVAMPFTGMGEKATEVLLSAIKGNPVENSYGYAAKLVVAESCGCTSEALKSAIYTRERLLGADRSSAKKMLKKRVSENIQIAMGGVSSLLTEREWVKKTIDVLLAKVSTHHTATSDVLKFFELHIPRIMSAFAETVDKDAESAYALGNTLLVLLNEYIKISKEFEVWSILTSVYRQEVLERLSGNLIAYTNAENLFQLIRVTIAEFNERIQKSTTNDNVKQEKALRDVGSALLTTYNIDDLLTIIANAMPKIGIPGIYLVLYNDCKYTPENKMIPERSRLVLAMSDKKRINLPENGVEFETSDILPDKYLPSGDSPSLVVFSLHFQDAFIGYIVFQSSKVNPAFYHSLRDQISSSLYGAILVTERAKSKVVIEETMKVMTKKADVAAVNSQQVSGNVSTISSSMEDFAGNIRDISKSLNEVGDIIRKASDDINNATFAINALRGHSNQINKSVSSISDIAQRINVLALNAGIEAAHAGDAGRGFGVVAKEVKALAAQTQATTAEIQALVKENTDKTLETEKVVKDTNLAIKAISDLSNKIKNLTEEQVRSSAEISGQLQNATTGTSEISSAIEEIASLGDKLITK